MIVAALCAIALWHPADARAAEAQATTVTQNDSAVRNGNDSVIKAADDEPTGVGSGTSADAAPATVSSTPSAEASAAPAEDPNKYLRSASGKIITGAGWHKLNGKSYYTNVNGVLFKGFKTIGKNTYYFDATTGAMKTGWQTIDGSKHYFASNGVMQKGWKKLSGKWYYFDPANNGAMATGFFKVGKKTYYGGSSDGAMRTGWQKISGKWYYFGKAGDGVMRTGWQKVGSWYYFDPSTGAMTTGMENIKNKTYYFGGTNDGAMRTGWKKLSGKWYNFGGANDGAMKKGWLHTDKWYYLDPSTGVMASNVRKTIGGKLYSFTSNGDMRANVSIRLNDKEAGYASSSGAIRKIGVYQGSKVILKPKDKVLTGWQKINGAWFFANGKGVMQTGWKWSNGAWYYLKPSSGAMATGLCKVNGKNEYFESNGVWNNEKAKMVARAQSFSSRTNRLVLVDVSKCRIGVFSGSKGNWKLIRYEKCVCGAPGSPTIRGTYSTGYHLGRLPKYPNALNCTNIYGGYFFHSILSSTSELGNHLSHGCVRLNWPTARYIQTLPYGSTVNLY